jgi:uncharacterized protein YdeI (YjbR/CyaY-like superfamily)
MCALQRPLHPMSPEVEQALVASGLRAAYDARPAYQRNDYLAWIDRAKGEETHRRRVDQMLEELGSGEGYMGMAWRPSRDTVE